MAATTDAYPGRTPLSTPEAVPSFPNGPVPLTDLLAFASLDHAPTTPVGQRPAGSRTPTPRRSSLRGGGGGAGLLFSSMQLGGRDSAHVERRDSGGSQQAEGGIISPALRSGNATPSPPSATPRSRKSVSFSAHLDVCDLPVMSPIPSPVASPARGTATTLRRFAHCTSNDIGMSPTTATTATTHGLTASAQTLSPIDTGSGRVTTFGRPLVLPTTLRPMTDDGAPHLDSVCGARMQRRMSPAMEDFRRQFGETLKHYHHAIQKRDPEGSSPQPDEAPAPAQLGAYTDTDHPWQETTPQGGPAPRALQYLRALR